MLEIATGASKGLGGVVAAIVVGWSIEVDKSQQADSETVNLNRDLQ
jgi:hypothetical protein